MKSNKVPFQGNPPGILQPLRTPISTSCLDTLHTLEMFWIFILHATGLQCCHMAPPWPITLEVVILKLCPLSDLKFSKTNLSVNTYMTIIQHKSRSLRLRLAYKLKPSSDLYFDLLVLKLHWVISPCIMNFVQGTNWYERIRWIVRSAVRKKHKILLHADGLILLCSAMQVQESLFWDLAEGVLSSRPMKD